MRGKNNHSYNHMLRLINSNMITSYFMYRRDSLVKHDYDSDYMIIIIIEYDLNEDHVSKKQKRRHDNTFVYRAPKKGRRGRVTERETKTSHSFWCFTITTKTEWWSWSSVNMFCISLSLSPSVRCSAWECNKRMKNCCPDVIRRGKRESRERWKSSLNIWTGLQQLIFCIS